MKDGIKETIDSKKDDRYSVRQLSVEDSNPCEEMAMDCIEIKNIDVHEAPPHTFNEVGVTEDEIIMRLHHLKKMDPNLPLSPIVKVIIFGCSRSKLVL